YAFLSGDSRRRARTWFGMLIALSLAVGGVQVLISFAARDFVTALANRDAGAFRQNLLWYLGTFMLAIPIGVFYKFSADRLSLAFFRGEKREQADLARRFIAAVRNTVDIIGWNRNLTFFTNTYNYVALVLPTLIVAPMYMRGAVEFGVVTQAEGAFAQVLMAV